MSKKEEKVEPKELVYQVPESRFNTVVQELGKLQGDLNFHNRIQSALNYLINGK